MNLNSNSKSNSIHYDKSTNIIGINTDKNLSLIENILENISILDIINLVCERASYDHYVKIDYRTKALCFNLIKNLFKNCNLHLIGEDLATKLFSVKRPSVMLESLFELNILECLFPNIYNLTKFKEGSKHHQEASVFEHVLTMLRLFEQSQDLYLGSRIDMIMSIVLHDIAKPYCYFTNGSSKSHDDIELIRIHSDSLLDHLFTNNVEFIVSNHVKIYSTHSMSVEDIVLFLEQFHCMSQLEELLNFAELDNLGRINLEPNKHIEESLLISSLWNMLHPDFSILCNYNSIHEYNIAKVTELIKIHRI